MLPGDPNLILLGMCDVTILAPRVGRVRKNETGTVISCTGSTVKRRLLYENDGENRAS